MATSFGARIALELARAYPADVRSVSLLAPALELDASFLRMANFLIAKGIGGEALQQAVASLPARPDFPTFLAVSRDALNHPFLPGNTGYPGPVRILFGRHDPLFDPGTDETRWRALFPDARIELVETGHMMAFELPEARWMPVA